MKIWPGSKPKLLILYGALILTFISCQNEVPDPIVALYANGGLKSKIEFTIEGDTLSKKFYREDGSIRLFLPFENDMLHGVAYDYDEGGRIIQEELFIEGKEMCIVKHYLNAAKRDTSVIYYKLLPNNLFTMEGLLKYDFSGKIIDEESYMYSIDSQRDTITIDEKFNFNVETKSVDKDSIYSEITLGRLHPDYSVTDTLYRISQWSRHFSFSVKPKKKGRNYVLGTVTTIVLYPELEDYAMDTMAFFKEYYVR